MRQVFRYEVPVDDAVHTIGNGRVLMTVPWRQGVEIPVGRVEVWVEVELGGSETMRYVQVFGTGHRIPDGAEWVGSCLDGPLVWHVYAVSVG